MALNEFKQGSVIHREGDPVGHLSLITSGEFETAFHGHTIVLEKADVIGIFDLLADSHNHTYTAASDSNAYQYPYEGFSSLEALMHGNSDIAYAMVNSTCRQAKEYMQYMRKLGHEAQCAYELAVELYPKYERLCKQFAYTPKKLPGLSDIEKASGSAIIDDWVCDYYVEICDLDPGTRKRFFFDHQAISIGFIRRCAEDMVLARQACAAYMEYVGNISKFFLNADKHDLFSNISDLHINSINIKGADAAVETLINALNGLMSNMTYIDKNLYQKRLEAYKETLNAKRESRVMTSVPSATGEKQNLAESLSVILEYSGVAQETASKFSRYVSDYTDCNDRASSDDTVHHMRRELTTMFNEIYSLVLTKYLDDPAPTTIIKMFLNFGYVDAKLAGFENADYLYSIADSLNGDPDNGIYTAAEWLAAIYRGKKDPCRNEFDMDYPAYIQEMKQSYKIDAAQALALLNDSGEKLKFELENIFPIVNKLTFGRITTYCPLFSDNNVQRGLEASLVTPDLIKTMINEIRTVDFSAFYRETMYSNPEIGVPKETIHVEIIPEVILMPNVGIRGIMWQDIEGRKRTTPGRMFMPLFMLNDLKTLLVTLTGEFRWEMCKRVQGIRWNDVTDASLTSEYCDYLQFYRTNRDLSSELKQEVKTELTRARNNWKNVFVSNYREWILYESNGAPRLNKLARRILSMYCPFSASIRESLSQNPQFTEHFKRYVFKQGQREQLLSRFIQKLSQTVEVPQELLDELEYVKR